MRLICPSCGASHSAEAWCNDADARQALRIVAELPAEISRRALPYLALFRPAGGSGRGLIWSKALRLLGELRQLMTDAYIQWEQKPARPNSTRAWAEALEQVLQRPPSRLPLKSHGYLRAVAYEIADNLDKQAERRANQDEHKGIAPQVQPESQWRPSGEDFDKLRCMIKGIGKKI